MSNYFNEEEKNKENISVQINNKKSDPFFNLDQLKGLKLSKIKKVQNVLGDVQMSNDQFNAMYDLVTNIGGKYDVRLRDSTIKGVYNIMEKYPSLNGTAIKELGNRYISDLYEQYDINSMIAKAVEVHTDDAFESCLKGIDSCANELQVKYEKDALKLQMELETNDNVPGMYSHNFVSFVKSLITRKHCSYDEMMKMIPTAELVKNDEKQLSDLARDYHGDFAIETPISYQMLYAKTDGYDLSMYGEVPAYVVDTGLYNKTFPATFKTADYNKEIGYLKQM